MLCLPLAAAEICNCLDSFRRGVLEPDPAKLITDPDEIRRLDQATRGK